MRNPRVLLISFQDRTQALLSLPPESQRGPVMTHESNMCKWRWLGKILTAWLLGRWESEPGEGDTPTTHSVTAVLAWWTPQNRRRSEAAFTHLPITRVPTQSHPIFYTLHWVWETSEAPLPATWDEVAELSGTSHLLPTALPALGPFGRWEHRGHVQNSSKRWWNWEETESQTNSEINWVLEYLVDKKFFACICIYSQVIILAVFLLLGQYKLILTYFTTWLSYGLSYTQQSHLHMVHAYTKLCIACCLLKQC